jgi:hypothetical protein
MASIPEGVQVYLVVSAVVAVLLHWHVRRYLLSCGASALISPFAFAAICAVFADMPTAVPPLVFSLFAAVSLLISAVVGIPFVLLRRVHAQQGAQADRPSKAGPAA